MPALTGALVTVVVPEGPEMGVGPAAASVQSAGVAVAPVVPLSTCLTRVRLAGWSSLVNVQAPSSFAFRVSVDVARGAWTSTRQSIETRL